MSKPDKEREWKTYTNPPNFEDFDTSAADAIINDMLAIGIMSSHGFDIDDPKVSYVVKGDNLRVTVNNPDPNESDTGKPT